MRRLRTEEELIGRNVAELATLSGGKEFIAPGFAGRTLAEIRRKNTQIEDYSSSG